MAGRQPYGETRDVIAPYGADRLRPPASLGPAERAAFVDLIGSVTSRHFVAADMALLCRWSELTVLAERAAKALTSEGAVIESRLGGKMVNPWCNVYHMAVKQLLGLSLRLRLGPQSRASKAPKTLPSSMSYYERQELMMKAADDDERNPS